jgi:hypothetical protein
MVGRIELVKSAIDYQAISYLTPLVVPTDALNFINKITRVFLWSAKDTTVGVKCKVNDVSTKIKIRFE